MSLSFSLGSTSLRGSMFLETIVARTRFHNVSLGRFSYIQQQYFQFCLVAEKQFAGNDVSSAAKLKNWRKTNTARAQSVRETLNFGMLVTCF